MNQSQNGNSNTILVILITMVVTLVIVVGVLFGIIAYKQATGSKDADTITINKDEDDVVSVSDDTSEDSESTEDTPDGGEDTPPEETTGFTLSSGQIDILKDYAQRLPNGGAGIFESREYTTDFIYYYYTGRAGGEDTYTENGKKWVNWHEDEVKETYKKIFGMEMPVPDLKDAENRILYRDGCYGVSESDASYINYMYSSVTESNDGTYDVAFDFTSGGYAGEKIIKIEPADNITGFVVKMVETQGY